MARTQATGHLSGALGGLDGAEGPGPYASGAPRKEERKLGPRGPRARLPTSPSTVNESPGPPTPSPRQRCQLNQEHYTNTHLPWTEKNDRKSRVPAAAAAFFRAARRWRRAFVSFWWHGVHKVRKLSKLQQPPPSATGIIWSACQ